MIEAIQNILERFKEGVSLTPSERLEVEQAERANRENDEAIQGGYSVGSRNYRTPEIPGLVDRIRRGLRNALSSGKAKGPR